MVPRLTKAARLGAGLATVVLVIAGGQAAAERGSPPAGRGEVVTDLGQAEGANAAALQANGKLVVAGNQSERFNTPGGETPLGPFVVARYNTDGSLDRSFGSHGQVTTTFGPSGVAKAVAIAPDSKIVVAGEVNIYRGVAIARYNPDGSLDTSFGTGGMVMGARSSYANAMAIEPDGSIVVAGEDNGGDFFAAKYLPNGSRDPSFGSGGQATVHFNPQAWVNALAIQPDGKIVLAGNEGYNFALARLNPDGSIDTTFGSGGKTSVAFNQKEQAYAVAIQPDGKIVAAGQASNRPRPDDVAVLRLNPNGSTDSSFGTNGKVTTPVRDSRCNAGASGVVIEPSGDIVTGGWSCFDFALVRYRGNGDLDTSFGSRGKVVTDLGAGEQGNALAARPDGGLLVAGPSGPDFGVAAYTAGGSPDSTFGGDGPRTRIVSHPPPHASGGTANFSFAPRGDAFECRLDASGFKPCEHKTRFTGLRKGRHYFEVRAVARDGSVDTSPIAFRWRVGD